MISPSKCCSFLLLHHGRGLSVSFFFLLFLAEATSGDRPKETLRTERVRRIEPTIAQISTPEAIGVSVRQEVSLGRIFAWCRRTRSRQYDYLEAWCFEFLRRKSQEKISNLRLGSAVSRVAKMVECRLESGDEPFARASEPEFAID